MENNTRPTEDDIVTVPDWFHRLNEEGARITSDLKKLDSFISSQAFRELTEHEKEMLRRQRFGMSLHQDAVRERFNYYNEKYKITAIDAA